MNPAIQRLINQREVAAKPFPLKSLLILYSNSKSSDTYVHYFEGFKELVKWLQPIEIPSLPLCKIPRLLYTYDIQEIAKILGCHPSIVYQVAQEITK